MSDREVTISAVLSVILSRCVPGVKEHESLCSSKSNYTHCSCCQPRVDRCLFGPINKNTVVPVVRDFRSAANS